MALQASISLVVSYSLTSKVGVRTVCRSVSGLPLKEDNTILQMPGVGFEHDFKF
jgi:hypothetical protein